MMRMKGIVSSVVLRWAIAAMLFVQTLAISVVPEAIEDEKNFIFFPPPTVLSPPLAPSSYGGHATPTPSHGGGYTPSPPANCGKPPSQEHHNPTPSSPSGGGYYHSPPSSSSTPTPTPTTPTIVRPPTTPITTPPKPIAPSPPFPLDPNFPPFTCIYWRNHPSLVWGLLGWWGTMATSFGSPNLPGGHMNLLQALSNTRLDSIGDLYREGTAAFLNSMVHGSKFPYTTAHIRDSFVAALSSKKAAAAQAQLFRLANEGRIKIRV